jgi:ankyrin repeat protein
MDFHDVEAVQMLLEAGALADAFDGRPVGGEQPSVIPALHQAARRMCSAEMIDTLLAAGADPDSRFEGCSAYGYARVFGNRALAEAIEARGGSVALTAEEALLAKAADGLETAGQRIAPETLPQPYQDIIRTILHLPGKLDHVRRLVALGLDPDRADGEGLTPVQVAGWEGLTDVMAYLLELNPDLDHINTYGGTLLSTILHGSENCPAVCNWPCQPESVCRAALWNWPGTKTLRLFWQIGQRPIPIRFWRLVRCSRRRVQGWSGV